MGLFSRVKDAQQQASQAMAGAGGMKGMMGGGDIYRRRLRTLGSSTSSGTPASRHPA
jgi:hypothetical protein